MLIKKQQISRLSEARMTAFEDEALRDLRTAFPALYAARGEEATRDLVRVARERARRYGFSRKAHVAQYIGVAFVLGARFDEEKALPWAGQILRDPSPIAPALRIERL